MKQRNAPIVVWVDPQDCIAPHGLDMDSFRDANKVAYLRQQFEDHGFDTNYSALVGYPLDGKIQLLSGTHRHLAAKQANIRLPVTIWLRSDIESIWGTELWNKAIQDIPVKELMQYPVEDGLRLSPYERIDFTLQNLKG
jgi:hypothetical protein